MLLPPLEVILSWPVPNYENPVVRGHYMEPVGITLMVLAGIVVILRLYSRWRLLKSFGWDDWLIIPATITAYISTLCNILSIPWGFGRHVWDVPLNSWYNARKLSWGTQVTFTLSIALTKISILLFYTRFATTARFTWAIRGVMAFVIAWVICMTFLVIFQCLPVYSYWSFVEDSKCLKAETIIYQIHGGSNLLSDVLVLVLPIPTILSLRLPKKQKIGLLALFSLGILVCISGALRLVAIYHLSESYDASWYGYDLWVYTSLECLVGILCASIPSLKPIIIKIFPSFGTTNHSKEVSDLTPVAGRGGHMGMSAAVSSGGDNSRKGSYTIPYPYGDRRRPSIPMNSMAANRHLHHLGNESEETIISRAEVEVESPPPMPPKQGVVKTTEIEVTSVTQGSDTKSDVSPV